jgi:hypothetical protein
MTMMTPIFFLTTPILMTSNLSMQMAHPYDA